MGVAAVTRLKNAFPDGVDVKMAAKKPFGGYTISFASVKGDSVSDIFGTGALTPSEMTKKIWVYVKKNKLSNK